jgi:hypothetical protein
LPLLFFTAGDVRMFAGFIEDREAQPTSASLPKFVIRRSRL